MNRTMLFARRVLLAAAVVAIAVGCANDSERGLARQEREADDARRVVLGAKCNAEAAPEADRVLSRAKLPADGYCREQYVAFVRNGLVANCLSKNRGNSYSLMLDVCQSLKNLRSYCPPSDWPSDASDPRTRAACRLG